MVRASRVYILLANYRSLFLLNRLLFFHNYPKNLSRYRCNSH